MTPDPCGRMGRGVFRCVSAAAAALLVAGSLAACGSRDAGLEQDVARQLQERVLAVSEAAAGNDHAAALSALDSLEADLAAAMGSGSVSEDRRLSITTAAAAVRADLNEAVAAAAAAEAKAAEEAAAAQRQAEADAAAEAAKSVPAPIAPAAPAEDKGNDNKGKGKGKDG
ncbi:MAG: hypothetical protein WAL27_10755 [Cellulosimicrobium cellulans]